RGPGRPGGVWKACGYLLVLVAQASGGYADISVYLLFFVTTTNFIRRFWHQVVAASCFRFVSGFSRNCPPLTSWSSFVPSISSTRKSGLYPRTFPASVTNCIVIPWFFVHFATVLS